MKAPTDSFISDLIRERRPGFSLPAELYTSEAAFRADLDVFFHRHWIMAAFEADVPEPGDVRAIEVGETSILILRDDDGSVRGFHNVCRHRGARLLPSGSHSVGRLICPYHQWSYDLTGELKHAAHMGRALNKSCFGLRPIGVRVIAGLVMVCIADDMPDDIDSMAAVLTPRLAPLDLARAKIAQETMIVEEGNWKLSIDNNRECYHCAGGHPELSLTFNQYDTGCDPDELAPAERAEWESHCAVSDAETKRWEDAGHPSKLIEHMTGRATMFRTQRLVIAGAGEAHTMDTQRACRKLLGSMRDGRMGDLHFWTHNSWHHYFADHAVVSYVVPVAPNQTLLRTVWLVNKDAVEGQDYDLERLTEVWRATNHQDAAFVAVAHKGISSAGYVPGPLSEHVERLVDLNLSWYIERLQAHGY